MRISPLCLACNIGCETMVKAILDHFSDDMDIDMGVKHTGPVPNEPSTPQSDSKRRGLLLTERLNLKLCNEHPANSAVVKQSRSPRTPSSGEQLPLAQVSNDTSPLLYAVSLGLFSIVRLLVDRGARVHEGEKGIPLVFSCIDRNLMGRTLKFPLFEYKQKIDRDAHVNHNLVLEVLMKAGADPNCK
jgi:ankyrin repeat protein